MRNRVWLRWLPAVVVPVVIAAGAVAAHATAGVDLPAKTPEQVLALAARSSVRAFSGTVEQSSQLGLPQLPASGSAALSGSSTEASVSSVLELVTGSHTARVFVDGPTNVRVQVMDTLAERDLVRQGTNVWLYDSAKATATHVTLPTASASHAAVPDLTPGEVQTPAQLAQKAFDAITPSTVVALGANTTVAGRTAYDLVLSPRTAGTLVGSVSIAVDSKTGMPLSVEVMAHGQKDAAFQVAFSALSLQTPAAGTFAFTPPAGTTVKQQAPPVRPDARATARRPGTGSAVTGSGWASIVRLPAGSVSASVLDSPLLREATGSVAGGRVLSTSLVTVLLTTDGRVFAGSVPVSALQAAASAR